MSRERRYKVLTYWQLGLFAGPILLHVSRLFIAAPFGESGQLAFAIGRFSLTVVCLLAVGVLEYKKYKLRTSPSSE